ncbi:MAG: SiaB family protein kinase [Treponema sp.]|nr:SiaB family protein kinase [Treponema sp.]
MIIDMTGLHNMLNEMKITFVYSGPLWSEGIGGLSETLKERLDLEKIPLNVSQEILSVYIEQLNNMLMYSEEKEKLNITDDGHAGYPKGTFILGKEGNTFFMQTGNIMKSENVEMIKNKIDYLNTLDKKELRSFYKEQLHSGNNNIGSKGAGLGLIEMARRISSKIKYSFTPCGDDLSFFALYTAIDGGSNELCS